METEADVRVADEATPSDEQRPKRRLLIPALIAGLAFSFVLAGVLAVLLVQNLETSAADVREFLAEERPEVDQRAERVVTLLLNYDATNIDEVSEELVSLATGNFREQYEELIPNLGPALEEASASSRGQILDGPTVAFRSPSEAIALARVTQTAQSNQNPTGRTIEYTLKLTLVNTVGEGWRADRVEILSADEGG